MEIEFDAAKDEINQAKHGISLREAEQLDWDRAMTVLDTRRAYGEERFRSFAPLGDRLYCAVFAMRDEVYRIISLRKANDREIEKYREIENHED